MDTQQVRISVTGTVLISQTYQQESLSTVLMMCPRYDWRERDSVCVYVRLCKSEGDTVCVCVCVCVRERG